MKKISFYLIIISFLLTPKISAQKWKFGKFNIVPQKLGQNKAELAIGRETLSLWKWSSARGVSFKKSSKSHPGLYVTKTAGGKCHFELKFKFAAPLKKFLLVTPLCRSINLKGGNLIFKYSTDKQKKFKELISFSDKFKGYRKGGNILPKASRWIEFPDNALPRNLTLRIVLEGYVSKIYFLGAKGNGAVLKYEYGLNAKKSSVDSELRMAPDAAKKAYAYYKNSPPRMFMYSNKTLKKVEVYDLGRKTLAGLCFLAKIGKNFVIDLPQLQAGVYELRFLDNKNKRLKTRRIVLLNHPRVLTWKQTLKSPFGIVGIVRNGRFRESADINGPALGQMMGVHQARTSGGPSWVTTCNAGQGKYKWGSYLKRSMLFAEYGIVARNSLAWTPHWAVDKTRVKKGQWSGHFPPKKEFLADYAQFCQMSAERTKGVFEPEFEIWNEPNNEPFGSFKGTLDEFVSICKTAAEAVLKVNPQARMILGSTGDADAGYIRRLFKAGLSKYYKIVDIHPYRHSNRGPEDGLLYDINRLKSVIRKSGNKQDIIFSEVGWPTHNKVTPSYMPVSELQQAYYNSRTLLISLAAGVKRVHFHIMRDFGKDLANPEHNFGFIKLDGSPKLTVSTFSTTARHLEHAKFQGLIKTPEFYHAWVWTNPWESDCSLITVWADEAAKKPQWLNLKGKFVKAEDIWGGIPSTDRLRIKNGRIQVKPGSDPIFIYVKGKYRNKLNPLPQGLRPYFMKKVIASKFSDDTIDFSKLQEKMTPAYTTDKSMGFAGIEGEGAGQKMVQRNKSSFSVYYDKQGLYLAVNVLSGSSMKNNHSNWMIWAGDCVRLYIGNDNASYMTDKLFQIGFAPVTNGNGPPQAVQISMDLAKGVKAGMLIPGATVKAQNTTSGWTMLAFVPWSYFPESPGKGDVWRFDISTPGSYWNSKSGDKWNNPLSWGNIQFN